MHLKRDPIGLFENGIRFPNGSSVTLQMPASNYSLHQNFADSLPTMVSELHFLASDIDSAARYAEASGFRIVWKDSLKRSLGFEIDSLYPIVVHILNDSVMHSDSAIQHPNKAYRIDWVLLSASPDTERKLRSFFVSMGAAQYNNTWYDYWRIGTAYYFTMVRFEPSKTWDTFSPNILLIEEGNIYYAY